MAKSVTEEEHTGKILYSRQPLEAMKSSNNYGHCIVFWKWQIENTLPATSAESHSQLYIQFKCIPKNELITTFLFTLSF